MADAGRQSDTKAPGGADAARTGGAQGTGDTAQAGGGSAGAVTLGAATTAIQQHSSGGTAVIAPGPTAACFQCGQPIGDQWVPFNESVCHPQCFCCEVCGVNVEEKYCMLDDPDGRHLLCENHYFERTNMVCAKCREPLDSTYVHAMGRKYHPDHFTCTACPTVFGPDGTYYEHEGDAYCLFHYTYLVAKKCAGCQQPIMKLFLQMNHRGAEEHWHPECYMIYKFWNVRIFPSLYAGGRGRVNKQLLKPQHMVSEQQIYQIWTVLSSFEESTAACISDMLLQVSGGHYLEGLRQAERFIMHVDVLFASIDDLEDELSHFDDSTGLQHTREPKLLCKKIVSFFSVLSHTQGNEANGLTQELLSLVTSLAHYLKVLTRVALKGALKAQTEYKCPSSIKALLSKLTETSDRQKWAMFRLSYQETDITSDLCTACHTPVETECIEHLRRRKRWHLYCFACSKCNTEIQHVYPQSAFDESASVLFCPECTSERGVAPGGFMFISQLEEYSFLMRVALKRLYGLLKMKNAVENPGMARLRKGEAAPKSLASGVPESLKQIAYPQLAEKEAAATEAAGNDFDAALSKLDRLEIQSSTPSPAEPVADRYKQQHRHQHQQHQLNQYQLHQHQLHQHQQYQAPARPAPAGSASDTPPINADMMSAMAKAAVKEAKNAGNIVHVGDGSLTASPPQVVADRRKPRVAHTTVHTMKARMENRGFPSGVDPSSPMLQPPGAVSMQPPQMRRAGQAGGPPLSVSALAAQQAAGAGPAGPAGPGKPNKLRRLSEEHDPAKVAASNTMTSESATKLKSMLSRAHTVRYLSDLNTAELFCAKHVAVSRLTALVGAHSDISQADLVALIGASKKTSAAGMWTRLKTNLMKKDGSAGGSGNAGGSGGKDRMRTATFGVPLETLLERQGVETDLGAHGKVRLQVPQFFELMLTTLSAMDLAVEGIFRKNGNIRRLREVTDAVDKDYSRVDLKQETPVQIAALLKKFLRELPDPLIPFRMRRLFLAIVGIQGPAERIDAFRHAVILMPQANRDMLNVLMMFLNWVATFSRVNEQSGSKMDIYNLSTVITPNILYADVKEPTRGDRDDTFSYDACSVTMQLMEASERLWMVSESAIAFLRENSSEFVESTTELNTKELLRRCERQVHRDGAVGNGSSSSSTANAASVPAGTGAAASNAGGAPGGGAGGTGNPMPQATADLDP